MPARSVCLVTLSLSEAGPGRFGGQVSVTDIYHTIPYHMYKYIQSKWRDIWIRDVFWSQHLHQHLPGTLGAGAKTRLESSIQPF